MARKNKKKKTLAFKNAVAGYLFIAPFIIGFILFLVVPLVQSLRMSFSTVELEGGLSMTWAGLENYRQAFLVDEQFVTSGFSRETAARMVNSALVLQRKDGMFSSVDVCSLDLYSGICEFVKAGAATTFIRRSNWVETITSTSMAAGLVQQLDFEKTSKKLYDGDYLVMVTDGVLDALPVKQEEETMKEIILHAQEEMPRELGRYILEKVLSYSNYCAQDDMTVLVAGMWKK